jgi:hypothetical protein
MELGGVMNLMGQDTEQLQEKVRFSGSEGVRWDKVGNKPADNCTFFQWIENQLGTRPSVHIGNLVDL